MVSKKFTINLDWTGQPIDHRSFDIELHEVKPSENSLRISWSGPFYGDPRGPDAPLSPEGFWKLWEYEVVEFFFLNDKDEYIEIEVAPSGHHLVLLFKGYRKSFLKELPLVVHTTVDKANKQWSGECAVPLSYLPPGVSKWNAYAIHKSDPERHYEQLSAAPIGSLEEPDFHRLEFFGTLKLDDLVKPDRLDGAQCWL